MLFPKPKNDRRSRQRERDRRDREFQESGLEDVLDEERVQCDCGHFEQKNKVCKHHVMRKRTEDDRYDIEKSITVCWDCHTEIHTVGDVEWALRHRSTLLLRCPAVYQKIMELRGGAPVDEIAGNLVPYDISEIM